MVTAVGAVDTFTAFTGTSTSCGRTGPVAKSFREREVIMEVLASRVLLHPVDFERSLRFYAGSLGLHVYREWARAYLKSRRALPLLGPREQPDSGYALTRRALTMGQENLAKVSSSRLETGIYMRRKGIQPFACSAKLGARGA
jgi:hypothetical protein